MGDTGRRRTPVSPDRRIAPMPRLAVYALIVCLLAVAAAVVSFSRGSWLGIVWVLIAGLSSNMCWYYVKRGKAGRETSVTN
ncbi:hypothetical protein OG866_31235 [Streptomyces sp. NBC_00663]|nr:hypothetical protein [Streptomyces sp. NBC_00663]